MKCWLECRSCHGTREVGPCFHGCLHCRCAPFEVRYEARKLSPDRSQEGIWRWSELLPPAATKVSLGEGGTPLLRARVDEGPPLWLKNETANPTWSFKDRFNTVSVSMARQFGMRGVAATTTGNHGMSAAAYAAAAGLDCAAFCHPDASPAQMAMMRSYGARVERGGDRAAAVRDLVRRGGWFPSTGLCPRQGFSNPYGVEGYKTIAFELFEQLGKPPDRVFVPLGGGDGLYGIWKGFSELLDAGSIERMPRMVGCQAAGSSPYVDAMRTGASRLTEVPAAFSSALSIAEAIGGEHALEVIRATGGDAVSSTDREIAAAARWLALRGIGVELSSAASVAACLAHRKQEPTDETWVAILTGAAIKWPETLTLLADAESL